MELIDLKNSILNENEPQNEAVGCFEGNGVALRCVGSLGVCKLNSILIHSLGGPSVICKLQKALLSERTIWNIFSNILNLLACLET